MPVEFLTDDQAAAYGRYSGPPARAQLERFFFLDDTDKALIGRRRGDHNRLGFAVQLATARYVGTFLADPVEVPSEVVDYLAEQLGVADPSCVKQYSQRDATHREHAGEIQREYGLRDFAVVEAELSAWVDARAWTTGEGPKATFDGAVAWLRERRVLLPGVSTLARLVARVQGEAAQRLWDTLYGLVSDEQRRLLDLSLEVPDGARTSRFDQFAEGAGWEAVGAADGEGPGPGVADRRAGCRRDRPDRGAGAAGGRAGPVWAVGKGSGTQAASGGAAAGDDACRGPPPGGQGGR